MYIYFRVDPEDAYYLEIVLNEAYFRFEPLYYTKGALCASEHAPKDQQNLFLMLSTWKEHGEFLIASMEFSRSTVHISFAIPWHKRHVETIAHMIRMEWPSYFPKR